MSLSIFVILALEKGLTTDDLNRVAKENSMPIEYHQGINLDDHTGFLPVTLNDVKTGVESYKIPYSEISSALPYEPDLNVTEPIVYEFRWSSDFKEGATAFYSSIIMLVEFNGITFDAESGTFLTMEQLQEAAKVMSGMGEK